MTDIEKLFVWLHQWQNFVECSIRNSNLKETPINMYLISFCDVQNYWNRYDSQWSKWYQNILKTGISNTMLVASAIRGAIVKG